MQIRCQHRLCPTPGQENALARALCARVVYNDSRAPDLADAQDVQMRKQFARQRPRQQGPGQAGSRR